MASASLALRKLLILVGCFFVVTSASATQVTPPESQEYCQAVEMVERYASIAVEGKRHLNRATFETDPLLDTLQFEASDIISFVRDSIAFEQYPGTLRGPKGTLLSRAGNALDQSVLLAKLLRDAGFDARIASAQLPDQLAHELLRQMKLPRQPLPSVGDVDALSSAISTVAEDYADADTISSNLSQPSVPSQSTHYDKVLKTTELLKHTLKEAKAWPVLSEAESSLAKEATEYYWVQYREMAADAWRDIHPAFSSGTPAEMPEAQSFLADTVPAELQHRFRLQIFIERLSGGKLEVIPVSEAWERPVANLLDVPLTVSNIPDALTLEASMQGRAGDSAATARFFIPMFNGAEAPGARYFDLQGNIIDPMVASAPSAGVFADVGRAFGQVTESLGGARPVLTAQWIELTLIAPGGEEQVYRRAAFDRLGPARRLQGETQEPLTATQAEETRPLLKLQTIMLSAAETPIGLRLDRTFEQYIRMRPVARELLEFLAASASGEDNPPLPGTVENPPRYWLGHLTLLSSFDLANQLSSSHRIYRASPGLFIHSQGPDADGGASEMVDIVTNPRRAVMISGQSVTLDPAAVMMTGVWDTAHEGALLPQGDSRLNTASVFAEASAAGIGLTVVRPGQSLSALDAGPDIKADVASDLARGFAVIIPERQSNPGRSAWWRVHPGTGETVGQITGGRGADLVEWLTVARPALEALSTYGFLSLGYAQCLKTAHNCTQASKSNGTCQHSSLCCFTMNTLFFGMGMGLMGVISIGWDIATFHVPICPAPTP